MTAPEQPPTADEGGPTVDGGRVDRDSMRQSAARILDDVPFFGRMAEGQEARDQLLDAIAGVPLPETVARQLAGAQDTRPEIYLHLLRTAITATWLARTPALTRCDASMAAAAGLLHDIGMLHVDPQILDPGHVLTREQQRQLVAHPLVSTTTLERLSVYPAEVVRAVGEHHECLDGSGYPRNLAGDAISPLGKVLSLAQVVAAMFAPGRSSPEMRLSVLLRMTWHRYDNAMAMQVLTLVKPQLDVMSAEVQLLDDPIARLVDITRLLRQWPLQWEGERDIGAARLATLEFMAAEALQIQRVLAGVGAVPEQLQMLHGEALDDALMCELTLLTREASWQLRALAAQARRRWNATPGEAFPGPLQQWLDEVDVLVAALSGVHPRDQAAARPSTP